MGTLIEPRCECSYSSGIIAQGGGFLNFMTEDQEPAYCPGCRDLVVANYRHSSRGCPRCSGKITFYNSPSLRKKPENMDKEKEEILHRDQKVFRDREDLPLQEDIQWGRFHLPVVDYFCPRCGKMTMKFYIEGTWD